MYEWPVLDGSLIEAITAQVKESLSDKGSSGIIKATEEKIANYYGSRYCLLFSSATGAMHSLAFALDLSPDDSVIAPAYTFFATMSPFAYEGINVVLCDVDECGQLSIEDLRHRYKPDVKAVICTHMWGIPCDLGPIRDFCLSKDISLIEDCSHAHTAKYDNTRVGRFGLASVFSTNQKFLTSGEGGFLLTDDRAIYERCLLLAHYNERCYKELTDSALRRYALTGLGLKYRAHPLAVAILAHQLDHIGASIVHRSANFRRLANAVEKHPLFVNLTPRYRYTPGLYVFPFLAKDAETRRRFIDHCRARADTAFDVPESTRPLGDEPLFLDCGDQVRKRYRNSGRRVKTHSIEFPGANMFHSLILKLPLWGHPGDEKEVDSVIETLTTFPPT
jgi:perosamine synthetase